MVFVKRPAKQARLRKRLAVGKDCQKKSKDAGIKDGVKEEEMSDSQSEEPHPEAKSERVKAKGPKRRKTFDIDASVNKAERMFADKWQKLKSAIETQGASMAATIESSGASSFKTEKELTCLRLSWLQAVLSESSKQLETLQV